MSHKLSDVAKVLRVHERTVIRLLNDDVNASFDAKAQGKGITIPQLVKAFNSTAKVWTDVMAGADSFIQQQEAARILKVSERTLCHWRTRAETEFDYRFSPDVEAGKTVRYSKKRLMKLKADLARE